MYKRGGKRWGGGLFIIRAFAVRYLRRLLTQCPEPHTLKCEKEWMYILRLYTSSMYKYVF